jgi:hypothetical protein
MMLLSCCLFPSIETHAADLSSAAGVQDYRRRQALLRMSRCAGFAAPAMLVMLSGNSRTLTACESTPGAAVLPTPGRSVR